MHVAETLRNIFRIPDLRNRILFTLGMLGVYRLGRHVPTPGVDTTALTAFFEHSRGEWFGIMDMFSGGNLSRVTIFALGIMPYISASIILQLLTVVWPYLERLSKEGELGRKKITEYTRYLTVLLSVIESGGVAAFVQNPALSGGMALSSHNRVSASPSRRSSPSPPVLCSSCGSANRSPNGVSETECHFSFLRASSWASRKG